MFGEKTMTLSLGLRRDIKWKFAIADIARPIIGKFFLSFYNLMVNIQHRKLVDNVINAKKISPLRKNGELYKNLSFINQNYSFKDILGNFKDIIQSNPTTIYN